MVPPDPLRDLRDRVRAAERIAVERSREEAHDELEALVALLCALRDLVPAELQQQVADIMRQVLLLLRAIVDYWVARLEPPAGDGRGRDAVVEEIPVE